MAVYNSSSAPLSINGELRSLNEKYSDQSNLFQQVSLLQAAATTSKLGINLGEVLNGIVSLTQHVDDTVPNLDTSQVSQTDGRLSIAQINSIPELRQKFSPALDGTAKSELASITESSAAASESSLNIIISSGSPEAIGAALKDTVRADLGEIRNVISNLQVTNSVDKDLTSSLDAVINGLFRAEVSLNSIKNNIFSSALGGVAEIIRGVNKGLRGIINNIVESKTEQIVSQIVPLFKGQSGLIDVPPQTMVSIISALSNDELDQAVKLVMRSGTVLPEDQVRDTLGNVNTNLVGRTLNPQAVTIVPKPIKTPNAAADTNSNYVTTEEELTVEFKSIQREITEAIITWTNTRLDQNLDATQLNSILSGTGGIPYHYIIRRDGRLQRGKDVEQPTSPLKNGHEKYGILIAFVGGLPYSSSSNVNDQPSSNRSLTSEQMTTFNTVLRVLYEAYPGIQVLGHNDIDRGVQAPGFDVIAYAESKFEKRSIYNDPSTQPPYSAATIRTLKAVYNEEL